MKTEIFHLLIQNHNKNVNNFGIVDPYYSNSNIVFNQNIQLENLKILRLLFLCGVIKSTQTKLKLMKMFKLNLL